MIIHKFVLGGAVASFIFVALSLLLNFLYPGAIPLMLLVSSSAIGLLFSALSFVQIDEEEAIFVMKVSGFLLIAMSVGNFLAMPSALQVIDIFYAVSFSIIGMVCGRFEEQLLAKDVVIREDSFIA